MIYAYAAFGGVLIGVAAVLLMAGLGRIAGISGMAGGLVRPGTSGRTVRIAFVVGVLAAPLILLLVDGDSGAGAPQVSLPWMILAGLLAGLGTSVGGGCTSGHGVCGIARLSPRSLLATAVFMVCGIVAVCDAPPAGVL